MFSVWLQIFFAALVTINFIVVKSEILESTQNLDILIQQSLLKFKLNVHKLLESNRFTRKKRSINYGLNQNSYHLKIGERGQIKVLTQRFKNIKTWSIVEEIDRSHLFWCNDYTFFIASFDPIYGLNQIQSYSHQMKGWIPYKSKHFRFDRDIYFIVLFYSTQKTKWLVSLFQWNRYVNLFIKKNYAIVTKGYTDVDIKTVGRQIFMGVSITYNDPNKPDDFRLYEWDKIQFDLRADEKFKSIFSIKLFTISSTLFIVTSQVNTYSEGSWLLKYDRGFHKKLIPKQVKQMMRAVKVEYFVVYRNSYFIFVGVEDAKIFWIHGDQFIEYQVLSGTSGAKDVATLTLPNNEVVIALLFTDHIRFYTESEDAEYLETSQRLNFQMYNVQVSGIFFHSDSSNIYRSYLIMAYNNYFNSTIYFSPIWYLAIEPYYQYQSQDPLLMCLHKATSLLDLRMKKINYYSQKINKVWLSNRVQKVTAPIHVKGRTIVSGKININQVEIKSTSSQYKTNTTSITNSQIKSRLDKIYSSLTFMQDELSDNLFYKNKTNQTVSGNIKFLNPIFALNMTVNNLSNNVKLNGLKFSDIKEKLLRTTGPQTISGRWSFLNKVYVDHVYINGSLNDIKPDDILLSNTPHEQVIRGQLQFEKVISASRVKAIKINGIPINHFITTSNQKVQYISGIKKLNKVESRNDIRVMGYTNRRNLTHHIISAIMVNDTKPQYLNGHIKFLHQVRVDNLYITGLINQRVNISQMLKLGLQKNGYQTIFGEKTFNQMYVQNISLTGQLNGLSVPYDLVSINQNQQVHGKFIFKESVIINSNLQVDFVNNIDLINEVVLRNSKIPQHIFGFKTFTTPLMVNGNVFMKEYVTLNGVDLSQFSVKVKNFHRSIFNRPLIFDDLIVTGNITAYFTVNNYLIQNLPKIMWSKSMPQMIKVKINFQNQVYVDWLKIERLNNLRFPKDFLIKNWRTVQYIVAPKKLDQIILRNSSLILAKGVKVNGFDLNKLNSKLVLNSQFFNQTKLDHVYGTKLFTSLEIRGNIYAKTVNNIDIKREAMLTNQPQIINTSFTLNSPYVKINNLQTRGLIIESTLFNSNISYWLSDVVLKSNGKVTLSNKHFSYGVILNKLNLEGTIKGINLNVILSRAVKINVNQIIKGPIVFKKGLHFYKSIKIKLINGLDFFNHISNLVLKNNSRPIGGKKIIYGNVTIKGNLIVNKYINGINLTDLFYKAASRVEQNIFTAPVTFTKMISIDRLTLSPYSTLDGVTFDDMVLLNSSSKIISKLVLKHQTRIDHNLTVIRGIVSGCNLTRLVKDSLYVKFSTPQHMFTSSRFQLLHVLGNVVITSNYINQINIKNIGSKLISLSTNQIVNTSLIFKDHVIVDNLIIRQSINNIDINYFLSDCVQRSKHQSIQGYKIFEKKVIVKAGHLVLNNDITLTGFVNGINLIKLNRSLVTTNGNYLIKGVKKFLDGSHLVFSNDVHIFKSVIGGIALRDLILLNSSDTILYPTFFRAPIYVMHNLTLLGSLNGKNLTQLLTNTISLSKSEIIPNDLVFNDLIAIDHLYVHKSVNNILVSSLITYDGNHIITGNYKFRNGVTLYGNLDMSQNSTINNINLRNMNAQRINLFKPEILNEKLIFDNMVELRNGVTFEAINGNNPSQVKLYYVNYTKQVRNAVEEYRVKTSNQNHLLQRSYQGALNQKIELEYFDIFFEFDYLDENNEEILIERFINSPFLKSNYYVAKYGYGPRYPYLYGWRFKTSSNCRIYSTFVYKILKNGQLVEKSSGYKNGRAFPIIYYLENNHISFSVWTNTTDCLSASKLNHSRFYPEMTLIKTFYLNYESSKQKSGKNLKHVSMKISSDVSKDFKYFNDGKNMYIVVAYAYDKTIQSAKTDTMIFKFDQITNYWNPIQKVATFGAIKLDLIYFAKEKMILLAICNRLTIAGKPMPSLIMRWVKEKEQFKQVAAIQTSSPADILFIETAKNNELFLTIANEKSLLYSGECNLQDEETIEKTESTFASFFTESVHVYKFYFANGKEPQLRLIQTLNYAGVNTLDRFYLPPDDTYLILGSKTLGKIFVLKLQGFNLFQQILTFLSPGIENVISYWSDDGNLFLAIGSSMPGKSLILKAYFSGPLPSRKALQSFLN